MPMNIGQCYYCGNSIYSDDECVSSHHSLYHIECKEQHEDEMKAAMDAEWLDNKRDQNNTDRILKHLKRTLKPKIWDAIKWETESNGYGYLKLVTINDVSGEKRLGHEYFGQSTAMRHVHDNTDNNTYSDGYGGDVYLYIGLNRYLKIHVWG